MVSKFSDALTSVTLVPLPPKSHSAMMPAVGEAGRGLQRAQRGDGIWNQRGGHPVGCEARLTAQRPPQGTDDSGTPVCGDCDRDRRTAADGASHRVEGLDEHLFTAVCRAVGRDQRNRIADPVDETAQHQTRLAEVGVLGWNTDLGGAVVEQRQYRPTHDRRIADACGHQVGHADRQPECVAHFMYPRRWPFPTIAAAVLTITYIPLVVSKPLMPSPLTA